MRIQGRHGLVYLSVHAGDAASPLAWLNSWTATWTSDLDDVTGFADTQVIYAAGQPDVTGAFTGFLDAGTSQTYIAATDGLPRDMFLYPDSTNMSQYFSGSVLADLAVTGSAPAAVTITVTWVAAGLVTRTGPGGVYAATYAATY